MSTKVRLAIIGAGGISHAHANGILKHQDKVECVALCDVSEANLDSRSKQLGYNPARFSDWKKMLAEMGDKIDAVDICLPHHLHAPAIFDAAAAGKHILCEKPMCINLEEADRIVAAVKKAGIIYMSAHNQLFNPSVKEIKRMIDAGDLGKVRWLRSQDCFLAGGGAAGGAFKGAWRANLKMQGGGELIDTGYHPCYRLMHLAGGDIAEIRGTMGRYEQEIEGEDTASVQVRFANGVIGEVFTSWAFSRPYGTHELHVIGDRGEVFGTGNKLYFLPRGFNTPSEKILPEADTFSDQMGYFADCIQKGLPVPHGPEQGRDVLKIILKASENADGWQKSARKA